MNFATGDNIGHIFQQGDSICRVYTGPDPSYPQRIYALYKKHCLDRFGIIQTTQQEDGSLLHPVLPLTYPHEWCPGMFKQAVLFHLDLLLLLDELGLTLKDALPENILFQHGRPVLVDFFSLVTPDDLAAQEWLPPADDKRYGILDMMFVPYMLTPLLLYAQGRFAEGRRLLTEEYCNNCDRSVPSPRQGTARPLWRRFTLACRVLLNRNPSGNALLIQRIISLLTTRRSTWLADVRALRSLVASLDVTPPESGYVSYYRAKSEDFPLGDERDWLEKQRGYAQALACCSPATVLELGANTGWFPRLAALHGATVITTDIDVACVERLYAQTRHTGEAIMPLWLSFDELSMEHFSLDWEGKRQQIPFHMAATKRLACDMVSCLGLLHHLTLGLGKSFADIAGVLKEVARRWLLVEFVALDDPLIGESPDFFSRVQCWNAKTYSIPAFLKACAPYFRLCRQLPSTPASSRTLLLLERLEP